MDKIVFRVYRDGETIALFPQIAASLWGYLCQSYQHVGQHGASDPSIVVRQTKPANRKQYMSLLEELERIGYNLVVMKRCTYKDLQVRKKQAEKWGG